MSYLTSIFAFVIAAGCFWMSVKLISLYLKVKKWQRVNATLISKEVFLHPKYSSSRAPYGLKATYNYNFNNINYSGNLLYLAELAGGQVNMMKSDAEKRLAKLENPLNIFINPTDPKQSLVYCEGVGLYVFVFFIGLLSCLVGLSYLPN